MLLFYFFLTTLGLAIGSFLGMLSFRLPRNLPITGRSVCDYCKKIISWRENIPILSYFLLSGKCLRCGKKISLRYPIIEFVTAIFFLLTGIFWLTGKGEIVFFFKENLGIFSLAAILAIVSFLIALAVVDFEFQLLPDFLLLPLLLLVLLLLFALPSPILFTNLFWGILSYSFFLFLFLVTRGRGMGFGDVKLAFIVGCLLGFSGTITWFYLSFLTGAVVGVILLLLGKAKLGRPIPFGPFLLVSLWITLFFGNMIWAWYAGLI